MAKKIDAGVAGRESVIDTEAARMSEQAARNAERVKLQAAADQTAAELESSYRYPANTYMGMRERESLPKTKAAVKWTIVDLAIDDTGKMAKTTTHENGYKAKNATIVTREVPTMPTTAEAIAEAAEKVSMAEQVIDGKRAAAGQVSLKNQAKLLAYLVEEAGFKPDMTTRKQA